jgi:hypothetical protein
VVVQGRKLVLRNNDVRMTLVMQGPAIRDSAAYDLESLQTLVSACIHARHQHITSPSHGPS